MLNQTQEITGQGEIISILSEFAGKTCQSGLCIRMSKSEVNNASDDRETLGKRQIIPLFLRIMMRRTLVTVGFEYTPVRDIHIFPDCSMMGSGRETEVKSRVA